MTRIEALAPSTNGHVKARKTGKPTESKPTATKASKRSKKAVLKSRQRLSLAVGGVGLAVLVLSLWHCTQALAVLTGSPIVLAGLLAVGIDAGMVVAELAAIMAGGEAQAWAGRYVLTAVVLSIGLNAFASAEHAERWPALAAAVGATIPCLVYMLARVAGHLWRD